MKPDIAYTLIAANFLLMLNAAFTADLPPIVVIWGTYFPFIWVYGRVRKHERDMWIARAHQATPRERYQRIVRADR